MKLVARRSSLIAAMRKLRSVRQGLCAAAARRKDPVAWQNRGAVLLSEAHAADGRVKFTTLARTFNKPSAVQHIRAKESRALVEGNRENPDFPESKIGNRLWNRKQKLPAIGAPGRGFVLARIIHRQG